MTVEHSRSAETLGDAPSGAAMGTWGLWLTIVVLTMFVAGLATAALYLETGQPSWPPEEFTVPGRGRGLLALGLAVVGAGAVSWALGRIRATRRRASASGLLAATAALTASVLVLASDLRSVGFRWDEHAYTSVYWSLTGGTMLFLAVGVLMVAAVLVQSVTGLIDERRHLELSNTAIYVWFACGTSVVLLALVHLLPTVGGGR